EDGGSDRAMPICGGTVVLVGDGSKAQPYGHRAEYHENHNQQDDVTSDVPGCRHLSILAQRRGDDLEDQFKAGAHSPRPAEIRATPGLVQLY
ncbi:MAG: hypothetical protein H6Q86_5799, partial [candidate division NC10 bacterium]|nr:hypothetical protein [candidate division NC10 bacterium]